MSFISKEISVLAGVSVGSLLVGGVFGYYLSKKANKSDQYENKMIHKSTSDFSSALGKYISEVSLREPEILVELRQHTFKNVKMSIMLADPVEAQLFRILLHMLNARKCIEVGVYTGYNTLNMALSLPSDGVVYALDINDEYVNHGKQFFKKANVDEKIDIRIGPAEETLNTLIRGGHAGSFDFIFIDADKPGYDSYYEKGLILLRTGGMIALDNMFQGGRVLNVAEQTGDRQKDADAINTLNHKLTNDSRVQISLLKIADGVTLCLKL